MRATTDSITIAARPTRPQIQDLDALEEAGEVARAGGAVGVPAA